VQYHIKEERGSYEELKELECVEEVGEAEILEGTSD